MNILRQIEKTMIAYKIPPSRLGREIANDPQLVFDLRRGREIGPPLAAHIRRCLKTYSGQSKTSQ